MSLLQTILPFINMSNMHYTILFNLEQEFQKNFVETIFTKTKKERQLEEIHNIADGSSQFMKDMLALDQEAYIKVMAVFFNAQKMIKFIAIQNYQMHQILIPIFLIIMKTMLIQLSQLRVQKILKQLYLEKKSGLKFLYTNQFITLDQIFQI